MSRQQRGGIRSRAMATGPSGWWLAVVGALAVLASLGVWLWSELPHDAMQPSPPLAADGESGGAEQDAPAERAAAPAEATAAAARPATDAIEGLLDAVSSSPTLRSWLGSPDWVRRVTAAVNLVASGQSPRAPLAAFAPERPFYVLGMGEMPVMSRASIARYGPLTRAVTSVDPQAVAVLYKALEPELEAAQREIGQRDDTFRDALHKALRHLLAVPVPTGPIALVPAKGALYRFADPALEELSPAQKHLVRMGPRNARKVQRKLRAIGEAVGVLRSQRAAAP